MQLIVDEGMSKRVLMLAEELDLILPENLRQKDNDKLAFKDSALRLFDYLNQDEKFCAHFYIKGQGLIGSLAIGPHEATPECISVSFANAKAIAYQYLQPTSFGIMINSFSVKEVEVYDSGKVKAVCYGFQREFIIKEKNEEIENEQPGSYFFTNCKRCFRCQSLVKPFIGMLCVSCHRIEQRLAK